MNRDSKKISPRALHFLYIFLKFTRQSGIVTLVVDGKERPNESN